MKYIDTPTGITIHLMLTAISLGIWQQNIFAAIFLVLLFLTFLSIAGGIIDVLEKNE